ncbi:MAG: YbjN domain-containing protein [Dermatophilaceae bacterium]|nr:YbjN domain-containing protein [Intrasporangiaceae bacterium]
MTSAVHDTLIAYLDATGLTHEPGGRDGEVVVDLPGEKKLKTVASVVVGESALSAVAFVVRNPDENHEQVYRYLLRKNLRLPGAAYAIDSSGDVYVVARLPLSAVDEDSLDALFGLVLDAADSHFNELLALGFLSSMKKEWQWRISRGESLHNLAAFRRLLEEETGLPAPDGALPG